MSNANCIAYAKFQVSLWGLIRPSQYHVRTPNHGLATQMGTNANTKAVRT
jgi:hypothetical protein